MVSAKFVLVAALAWAGTADAQDRVDLAELIERLRGDDVASVEGAMQRLRVTGSAAAVALATCAAGEEPARSRALLVLRQLGTAAEDAVPHLVASLESCVPAEAPVVYETLAEVTPLDAMMPREIQDQLHVATERLLRGADDQIGMAIRHGFVRVLVPLLGYRVEEAVGASATTGPDGSFSLQFDESVSGVRLHIIQPGSSRPATSVSVFRFDSVAGSQGVDLGDVRVSRRRR